MRRVRSAFLTPVSLAAISISAFFVSPTSASNVTYVVDPSQSALTLSGTWGSSPFVAINDNGILNPTIAGATGLVDSFGGTITADRDFQSNTFQITGGSVVAGDGGFTLLLSDTDLPPNYAVGNASNPGEYGVVHGFIFSPSSSVITSPMSFASSQINGSSIGGLFSYATITTGGPDEELFAPSLESITNFGDSDLEGIFGFGSGIGSLTDVGDIESLTIPIDADIDLMADGQPLDMHFSGSILATADVPEPRGLTLVTFSVLFLLRWRRLAR